MLKKPYFWLIAAVLLCFAYALSSLEKKSEFADRQNFLKSDEKKIPLNHIEQVTGAVNESEVHTESAQTSVETKKLEAPEVRTVREEISRNPHETPESLFNFSHQVAEQMGEAMQSEEKAAALMSQLDRCVKDQQKPDEGVEAVESFCLKQAKKLAGKFPGLKSRYQEIFSGSSERAKKILNLTQ